MKPSNNFQMRLQSLVVLLLVPTLLLVIAGYGWSNYYTISTTILQGFDRKLEAVDTTSAAMIDGDEHQRLYVPREIHAIAYNPAAKTIFGIDRGNKYLVSLTAEGGSTEELAPLNFVTAPAQMIRSLTFDSKNDRLVGLFEDRLTIVNVDAVSGTVSEIAKLETPSSSIAYDASKDEFLLAGEILHRWRAGERSPRAVARLGLQHLQGLVGAETAEEFFALDSPSGFLFRLNGTTGTMRFVGPLVQDGNDVVPRVEAAPGEEAAQWSEPQIVKLPAHGLAFDPETRTLFGTTDRLITISTENGKGDPANFRAGFRSDISKLYVKYAAPMSRIMAQLGLTYHYTLVLPAENQQIYVLDATEGEDHSLAGTEEAVETEESQRLSRVLRSGEPSQSEVKQFDIWGMLKVGTAPIFNSRGEPVALAGADVNISVIQAKTRVALLQLFAIGSFSLILAIIASFFIARRLIEPVNKVKEGALQVAAGQFARPVDVTRPKELFYLAKAFDQVRTNLRDRISTLQEENDRFEFYRRRQELIKVFAREGGKEAPSLLLKKASTISAQLVGENTHRREASGWVEQGELVMIWLADSPADALKAVRLRADIRRICGKKLELYGSDWDSLASELEPLFKDCVYLFVLLNAATGTVNSLARRPAAATLVSPEKSSKNCMLLEHPRLKLERGYSFIISSRQQNAEAEAIRVNEPPRKSTETNQPELYAVMRSE